VIFNRDFVQPTFPRDLNRRKSLFGAVAVRNETRRYSLALLLLTAPARDGTINVLACRSNGTLMYGGTAILEADTATFSLRAVERPGAFAVSIEGVYDGGTLKRLHVAATPLAHVEKQHPIED
jgi:hypothetical protein